MTWLRSNAPCARTRPATALACSRSPTRPSRPRDSPSRSTRSPGALPSAQAPSTGTFRPRRRCSVRSSTTGSGASSTKARRWPERGAREALFVFLRSLVAAGATDHGLADSLAGAGVDVETVTPETEHTFLQVLGELVGSRAAGGSVRSDVGVPTSRHCWSGVSKCRPPTRSRPSGSPESCWTVFAPERPTLHSPWSSAKNDVGTRDR